MASHYVSLNLGEEGFKYSDFAVGTTTTAGDIFELRVLDGAGVRTLEVIKALEAFERFFANAQEVVIGGFDVVP